MLIQKSSLSQIKEFFELLLNKYLPQLSQEDSDIDRILQKIERLVKSTLEFKIFKALDLSEREEEILEDVKDQLGRGEEKDDESRVSREPLAN